MAKESAYSGSSMVIHDARMHAFNIAKEWKVPVLRGKGRLKQTQLKEDPCCLNGFAAQLEHRWRQKGEKYF